MERGVAGTFSQVRPNASASRCPKITPHNALVANPRRDKRSTMIFTPLLVLDTRRASPQKQNSSKTCFRMFLIPLAPTELATHATQRTITTTGYQMITLLAVSVVIGLIGTRILAALGVVAFQVAATPLARRALPKILIVEFLLTFALATPLRFRKEVLRTKCRRVIPLLQVIRLRALDLLDPLPRHLFTNRIRSSSNSTGLRPCRLVTSVLPLLTLQVRQRNFRHRRVQI